MSNLENQQLQKENRWLELTEMEETVNKAIDDVSLKLKKK